MNLLTLYVISISSIISLDNHSGECMGQTFNHLKNRTQLIEFLLWGNQC